MVVCSCQAISDRDIHAAINWMRAADETAVITPVKIYRALGMSPECGGCTKLFVATMRAKPTEPSLPIGPYTFRQKKTPPKSRRGF